MRTQNGAENMAVLRKLGLQVFKKNKEKRSIKNTRKKAVWSDEFLLQITQDFFRKFDAFNLPLNKYEIAQNTLVI